MDDSRVVRSVTLGAADVARQAVTGKDKVKMSKAVAVAASSLAYQYVLAAPLQKALAGANQADLAYAWDLLVEILGVATTLYIFEMMGLVAPKTGQIEEGLGEGVGGKKKKSNAFVKSIAMAGVDVFVAEVILALMSGGIKFGADPSAATAPAQ